MTGRRLEPSAVLVLVLAVVSLGVDGWSTYGGCAGVQVEATSPGELPAEPHCVREFTPMLLLLLAPILLCGLGLLLRRPWLAWSGAVMQGLTVLVASRLSTSWLRAGVALALLGSLAWWHWGLASAPPARQAPRSGLRIAVFASAGILTALALFAVVPQVPEFWDPCNAWGVKGGGSTSAGVGSPCPSSSSFSHTKTEQAEILVLIFGIPIVLAVVSAWAAWRARAGALIAAGVVLAVHAVPLIFLALPAFLLTWPVAALWIGAGVEARRKGRSREPGPVQGPPKDPVL